MIDKRVRDLVEAVAGIPDGATILCAGFGGAGLPDALCEAVIKQGARGLTVVANNGGTRRTGDVALLSAERGDRWGNLTYRKSARNFNPTMAMAADLSVVQVRRIVELGELDPEMIVTPGIFIDRLVEVAF